VWAITSLRPSIEGTRFLVRCDHMALKWILTTTACTNNRLNRWRIRLTEFDYDVAYKPGRHHAIADALFRMPTEALDTKPIPEAIPVVGVTTRSGAVLDPHRPENKGQVPISMAELAKEQLAGSFCQEIRKDMDTTDRTQFYENGDGMLCRHGQQERTQQVDVPRSVVADVLEREHSSPLGGHLVETKMYRTLRRRYYWPSLAADVVGWVAACATCAKNRLMEIRISSGMRLFPATEPFEAVAIDLLGPLPRTPEGYEYLLVMCDRFLKLTRVVPLRDVTALDVLSAFIDVWIASHGIPDTTLSANRPHLHAYISKKSCKCLV